MTAEDRAAPEDPTDREAADVENILIPALREAGVTGRLLDEAMTAARDAVLAWLRDRDAAPTAPERVELGIRWPDGNVFPAWCTEEEARKTLARCGPAATLVRRTVTEWVAVDE